MRTRCAAAALAVGLAAVCGGCHGGNRRLARNEPGLDPSLQGGTAVAAAPEAAAPASPAWVDRHPLFSRPRDIYEGTASHNKLVKGAAATVVGVPVGLFGELRQIVVGTAPGTRRSAVAEAYPDEAAPSAVIGERPSALDPPGPSS